MSFNATKHSLFEQLCTENTELAPSQETTENQNHRLTPATQAFDAFNTAFTGLFAKEAAAHGHQTGISQYTSFTQRQRGESNQAVKHPRSFFSSGGGAWYCIWRFQYGSLVFGSVRLLPAVDMAGEVGIAPEGEGNYQAIRQKELQEDSVVAEYILSLLWLLRIGHFGLDRIIKRTPVEPDRLQQRL